MKIYLTFVLVVVALLFVTSCGTNPTSTQTSNTDAAETQALVAEALFGDTITLNEAMAYQDLLGQMSAADSLPVRVRGVVSEVCQAKGCWMTLVHPDAPNMMVKFKDYGFFVPKNISGREVIMEGVAYKEVTPIDELQHYAKDAGKSEEEIAAIDKPKEEFKFLASGVALLKD